MAPSPGTTQLSLSDISDSVAGVEVPSPIGHLAELVRTGKRRLKLAIPAMIEITLPAGGLPQRELSALYALATEAEVVGDDEVGYAVEKTWVRVLKLEGCQWYIRAEQARHEIGPEEGAFSPAGIERLKQQVFAAAQRIVAFAKRKGKQRKALFVEAEDVDWAADLVLVEAPEFDDAGDMVARARRGGL